jgi:hypothetical protein
MTAGWGIDTVGAIGFSACTGLSLCGTWIVVAGGPGGALPAAVCGEATAGTFCSDEFCLLSADSEETAGSAIGASETLVACPGAAGTGADGAVAGVLEAAADCDGAESTGAVDAESAVLLLCQTNIPTPPRTAITAAAVRRPTISFDELAGKSGCPFAPAGIGGDDTDC